MLEYEQALNLLELAATKYRRENYSSSSGPGAETCVRTESVSLRECVDRYAARDIFSLEDNPRFDNSAMDGFAVLAIDTKAATDAQPLRLPIAGCLGAGESSSQRVFAGDGVCVEIMTGARIPFASAVNNTVTSDAVIRLEDVRVVEINGGKGRAIEIRKPANVGENIRYAGSDYRKGDLLISAGTRFDIQHLLVLATNGVANVDVVAKPRIVLLSTGTELVPFDFAVDRSTSADLIRNSTGPFLEVALKRLGCEVIAQRSVRDNEEATETALAEALALRPDLIITTGGVSVGKFDYVPGALETLGAQIIFHKVAIRPGKPILMARFTDGPVLFGLPGNPISVAVGLRFFVTPYLRGLFGAQREKPRTVPLNNGVKTPKGLKFFQRAVIREGGAEILEGQASFRLQALLNGEGWSVGKAEADQLNAGDVIDWYSLW